ncbi:autotransporter domain-containing protein, partial [Campylobacter sp. M4]
SKIACVALLSASISTVALADKDAYESAVKLQKDKTKAVSKVLGAINTLKSIGSTTLAKWNGKADADYSSALALVEASKKNDAATNKKIYDAMKIIEDQLKTIKGSSDLEIKGSTDSKLVLESSGALKLTIAYADNTALGETTITLDDLANSENIAKMFAENNKDVWDKFIAEFKKENEKNTKERSQDIDTKALVYANAAAGAVADYDANVKHQDALSKALEKDIAEKKAEAEKQTTIRNELKEAFDDAKKAIDETASDKDAKIAAFNKLVKKHGVTLKDANKDGNANIDKDTPAVEADFSAANLSDKITSLDTATTNASAAADADLKTAKENLKKFNDHSSDSTIAESKLAQLDPKTPGTKAKEQADKAEEQAKSQKAFDAKLKEKKADIDKAVTLTSTKPEDIKKQTQAVTEAKNALTTAAGGADDAKKNAIADAIKAGVPVEKDGKKITEAEAKALEAGDIAAVLADATDKTTKAETALNTVNAETNDLVTKNEALKTANEELNKAKDETKQASNARAKAIVKTQNLNTKEAEVLGSFSDAILSNETIQEVITNTGVENVADIAKDLTSSFGKSSKVLNKGISTEIINFSTGLATNTRLAKLANPYNADLALAKAINDLSGEAFADNGSSLSSIVKEYTNRFNNDNNLWGNVFGGKAKIKDSANPTIWGVTLGYDRAFDNTIVGGYLNYAQTQAKDSQVRHESDNYSFGVYSRSYFGENEIDAKIGYGFGKNDLERTTLLGTNEGKYDSKFFDASVDYGYVFGLGDAKFIKPMLGLSYLYVKNDGFTDSGKVPVVFSATSAKTLSARAAAEFRAYADNGSYFYITPGVERELSKSVDDLGVQFVGSSKGVIFNADKKKDTYFMLKTGAEFKITNSLSTNLNFGAKAKSKEQYYNGTLGISYKF